MGCSIQEYLETLKGKKVTVLGIGISNTPLIGMLQKAGVQVTACDKREREKFDGLIEDLEKDGVSVHLGPDYLEHLAGQDVIFRTPGMRPDLPQLSAAVEQGSLLTSEMEVFFQLCPCPIIGITGSDGKTTTTTIVAELLKAEGYHVHLGGNIGKPLLPDIASIKPEDLAVVELSSFQLMTMRSSPHISIITNLAPNHLDVHRSMEEYIEAKKNIFLHQYPEDRIILNADNPITRSFVQELSQQSILFSRKEEPEGSAVFLRGDMIWVRDSAGERAVLPKSGILLPGEHNVENYMAAIAATNGLVKDETIRSFASSFGGVEHRIELVRTLKGVRYYNDSIASSPTRTIAGLNSFSEKVILIAGGYDKHIPFDVLGPEIIGHVKHLILTGHTAQKIRTAVEKTTGYNAAALPIDEYDDFQNAVEAARNIASYGDVVLLSPACASFDKFKNFMERGNTFKKIVQNFSE